MTTFGEFKFRPTFGDIEDELVSFFDSSGIGFDQIDLRLALQSSHDSDAFLFCLSVLRDLLNWGAKIDYVDGGIHVSLPQIGPRDNDPETKKRIREAMSNLKTEPVSYEQIVTTTEAIEFLEQGRIKLVPISETEKELAQVFRRGLSTWSMPYRGREGRTKRFILFWQIGNRSIPGGILEIGDDAPHNRPRDQFMGLARNQSDFSSEDLRIIGDRLLGIRRSLIPDGLPNEFGNDISNIQIDLARLKVVGQGRNGTASEIALRKRMTYLYRLLRSEMACRGVGQEESSFSDGLRVIRDLTIPRANVEMTICGAVPPFGELLGGKILAAMAGHPTVRDFVNRDFGQITKSIFDTSLLANQLPRHGALFVTTKGLFPGHSSQYNAVNIPGLFSPLKLRKIGDTQGSTTSHFSNLTMKLAVRTVVEREGKFISREFGSGGAKRQRTISAALRSIGLPINLGHAQISRPVYGLNLVSNLDRVIIFNEPPDWLVCPFTDLDAQSAEQYEKGVLALWRNRWLPKAKSRILPTES